MYDKKWFTQWGCQGAFESGIGGVLVFQSIKMIGI